MVEKLLVTADGSQIHYDLYPKAAPTVVLLHGNGGNRHYFDRQLPIYQQMFQVIVVDSRGQGLSTNHAATLSFDLMAHDLYELLQQEQLKTVSIVGFSDGANYAMVFAVRFAKLVDKLVLNAGNVSLSGIGALTHAFDVTRWYGNQLVGKVVPVFKQRAAVQSLLVKPVPLAWDELQKIQAKTLVIAGERDAIKVTETAQIAEAIPDSEFMLIPTARHSFGRQHPQLFAQMATNFIEMQDTK
ncbi:alpha/beta hydrolase [Periweissella cryptocerci]|uniref:Alpha/beta hydrolase n=1 Tax=Periweissella cryptocerci TaxID=2506420 RepID=A0A4P6YRR7_9LACO|nr:alpha/beta hydrolase [Periweissella cryptocerci]QBO35326.1 alpha/beta hydrolase [Periweissella cryptocerci]